LTGRRAVGFLPLVSEILATTQAEICDMIVDGRRLPTI